MAIMIKASTEAASILLLLLLLLPITTLSSISSTISTSAITNNNNITTSSVYNFCSPFTCGNITFPFPFSSSLTFGLGPQDCGLPGYQIACDDLSVAGLILSGRLYQVKDIYPSESLITVVDTELIEDFMAGSCTSLRNLTMISSASYVSPLSLPSWTLYLTLFQCPTELTLPQEFLDKVVGNITCREGNLVYVFNPLRFSSLSTPDGCKLIRVPVSTASFGFFNTKYKSNNNSTRRRSKGRVELANVLSDGFALTWPSFEECNNCHNNGERCGFDGGLRRIVCIHEQENLKQAEKKWKNRELTIGLAAGCCFAMFITAIALRRQISPTFMAESQNDREGINAKRFIRTYRSGLLNNYTYNDIKKMTKNFKEKLGEGGFGNVYKGELDGRLVAVKLLEKSRHFGHDFVNEVAAIGGIHHVNVISLLGFCWNGSKQALIYEFMPNGSLADLLSNEEFNLSLEASRILKIAMGIAHGIEYLHNGCESRILHLDIKPHNVLLDQSLNPKISDFGLAKVYSRSQSTVSMTNAKGTIGYIAPEIFMKNFGNASDRSDVYSFGMLLLEMVEGKNHLESKITTSSDAYFPCCIYKLIQEKQVETVDSLRDGKEDDHGIIKKMIMVGLWCIQINPKDRPSMTRVMEMLTGDVAGIQMPPKPLLFSPPRIQHEIDIASIDSDISELSSISTTNHASENWTVGAENSCKLNREKPFGDEFCGEEMT